MIDEYTLSRINMAKRYAELHPDKAKSILGYNPVPSKDLPKAIAKPDAARHEPKSMFEKIVKDCKSGKREYKYNYDDNLTSEVLSLISDACMCSLHDLQSRAKSQGITIPRAIFCYVERKLNKRSYPEIAAILKKDHTAIIDMMRRFRDRYKHSKIFEVYMKNDRLREIVQKAIDAT
jgi:Bacterial dnaA protein helix-turn-helix